MGRKEHLHKAPDTIRLGILTVSSTRTEKEDQSGQWIKKQAEKEGHLVAVYRIIADDHRRITRAVTDSINAHSPHGMILTGGTGVSAADVTIEALQPMFSKELGGFASLFAWLSFEKIDAAALLSRSAAGVIGRTAVFCLPGSLDACKLGCRELIFPEIRHIAAHLNG
ncbi:MAG: molybdenum cofactor biosynthesis protein [Desulfobacteraceae bacterium]|nr:molybdenum cofactor biosynthesis protein [Desulfobacteraceae bacterium]MCF8095388.1 molybdenum cofactor biosynthesis protein [Desulfobacteraceae bacterium]